jgi:hypothetical protein
MTIGEARLALCECDRLEALVRLGAEVLLLPRMGRTFGEPSFFYNGFLVNDETVVRWKHHPNFGSGSGAVDVEMFGEWVTVFPRKNMALHRLGLSAIPGAFLSMTSAMRAALRRICKAIAPRR